MPSPRLLVIEGNSPQTTADHVAVGGTAASKGYSDLLRELLPGTNVNAFILTQVVQNALTIPRNAIRHDSGVGVYVLSGNNTIRWQNVRTGVSEALKVEVVSGLKEGDAVAEATDQPLHAGEKVDPVIQ